MTPVSFIPTDIGNAELLIREHGADLRYVHKYKSWMVWDGARWMRDETGTVGRRCKQVLRGLVAYANSLDDDATRSKLISHAIRSEQNGRIQGMIERAKSEEGVGIDPSYFDARPMLLTVANGTLDLETGRLLPHDRAHLSTKVAPVHWNPEAPCPTWEKFLRDVFAERQDMVDYVQRAVGYSLTGDTSEQCLQLMHGTGSNGKSTFLEIMQALMGDYGAQADFTTFLEGKGDGPRNDIARLVGARMVRSSEVGEGKRFNESLVKALTGSETIAARFLYSESFEFTPQFKLWFAANHKPTIRGQDHAIWRRVRLIPFDVQFTGDRRDSKIKQKLMAELPGILVWAVAGCLLWRKHGLNPPADVVAATEEYRRESDVIGAFLEDCCIASPGYEVPASELYHAFKRWAKDNGEYELSQTAFGRRLDERGFSSRKSSIKYRTGLKLAEAHAGVSEERPWF